MLHCTMDMADEAISDSFRAVLAETPSAAAELVAHLRAVANARQSAVLLALYKEHEQLAGSPKREAPASPGARVSPKSTPPASPAPVPASSQAQLPAVKRDSGAGAAPSAASEQQQHQTQQEQPSSAPAEKRVKPTDNVRRLPVLPFVHGVDRQYQIRASADAPVGLANMINLCFFNSLAQVYYALPPVRELVFSSEPEIGKEGSHACTPFLSFFVKSASSYIFRLFSYFASAHAVCAHARDTASVYRYDTGR